MHVTTPPTKLSRQRHTQYIKWIQIISTGSSRRLHSNDFTAITNTYLLEQKQRITRILLTSIKPQKEIVSAVFQTVSY